MEGRVIDIQRRMTELGHIRMGDKKGSGKDPRRKLVNWRLTSADRTLLDGAVAEYGGTVQPWEDAPDEGYFEAYLETDVLHIMLARVFSQLDGSPTLQY